MIYDYVVKKLEQAEGLGEYIFPVGVNIDDIYTAENDFSFTVYTFKSRVPHYDLEGELHHYTEEVIVDFIGRLYSMIHAHYDAAEASFAGCNFVTDSGEYIFFTKCLCPEPDAFDMEYGLLRRTMLVTIDWCP